MITKPTGPPAAPPPAPSTPPPAATMPPPPQAAIGGGNGQAVALGHLDAITVPRVILNCVEGWGKTSTGAFMSSPVILCAHGENGYQTLLGSGLVPSVAGGIIESWPQFLATLDALIVECPYQTLVLDALGGFEAMCHQYVCQRDFKGDMGPKGFLNYHKGYDVSVTDWNGMLAKVDQIHGQGVTILALSHCQDKTIANPLGDDYAKYVGSLHHKTWSATKRWADAVLFGKFLTIVDGDTGHKKGIGGSERILYTEHRDAYDAKNRYNMPAELMIPADPAQVWATIYSHMQRKDAIQP